jgi:hypothetical protein
MKEELSFSSCNNSYLHTPLSIYESNPLMKAIRTVKIRKSETLFPLVLM